jgi:hypothetical protein
MTSIRFLPLRKILSVSPWANGAVLILVLLFGVAARSDTINFPGSIPGTTVVTAISHDGEYVAGTYEPPPSGGFCTGGLFDLCTYAFTFHDGQYQRAPMANPLLVDVSDQMLAVNDLGQYVGREQKLLLSRSHTSHFSPTIQGIFRLSVKLILACINWACPAVAIRLTVPSYSRKQLMITTK